MCVIHIGGICTQSQKNANRIKCLNFPCSLKMKSWWIESSLSHESIKVQLIYSPTWSASCRLDPTSQARDLLQWNMQQSLCDRIELRCVDTRVLRHLWGQDQRQLQFWDWTELNSDNFKCDENISPLTSNTTACKCPCRVAQCKLEACNSPPTASTLAPRSSRNLTMSNRLLIAAQWRR